MGYFNCAKFVPSRWDEDDVGDGESTGSSLYSPSFYHYKPPGPKSIASDSLDRNGHRIMMPPAKGRFTPEKGGSSVFGSN